VKKEQKIKVIPKAKRIKILYDKCWELMSLYVRLKSANSKGMIQCVTCGRIYRFNQINAGHFKHGVLNFDEININCQCVRCNKFLHGNLINYYNFILLTYGKEALDDLLKRAAIKHKYTEEELSNKLVELSKKVDQARNGECVL
jgi:hypothetical protein